MEVLTTNNTMSPSPTKRMTNDITRRGRRTTMWGWTVDDNAHMEGANERQHDQGTVDDNAMTTKTGREQQMTWG
jgi:hypothetical protein